MTGISATQKNTGGPRLLKVDGVIKDFPGLRALNRVSFELRSGEVLAVVGQNGCGKSTLVKVLAGVYKADGGDFTVEDAGGGEPVQMHFIHQTRALIPSMTTIENLALGRAPESRTSLAKRRERRRAERLIGEFGLHFDVTKPISEISPAERTIVAIVRALDGWTRPEGVLVLDEPTAELHGEEAEKLFEVVRQVAAGGAGVIFISHRLDEVMALADRVLALRDGAVVGHVSTAECDHDQLIHMIVGRRLEQVERRPSRVGDVVLEARGVGGGSVVDVDLTLREGEILGLGGIVGSGRETLVGLLFGAHRRERGEVEIDGRRLPKDNITASIANRVAYVPADRAAEGAVMEMSVRENLTLPGLRGFRRAFGWLDLRSEAKEVSKWTKLVNLRPVMPSRRLDLFSGGNQQKVVIAKWLRMEPRALLLEEPTQGVDIGAKVAIYELLQQAAAGGAGVLLASADAKELTAVCDRVLVMRDGRIVAEAVGTGLSEAHLLKEELGLSIDQLNTRPSDNEEEILA
ncbi:MAG: sugar ABC transporter ATP-binding protein [Actinobacteria bacterium]|nr:sugar ABC transporter ATP-binding protein [Actinomycetota bacterium]